MTSAATEVKTGPRYAGLRVTREEYLDLEDDGCRYDMIGGVLQVTPSPDFEHGGAVSRFLFVLEAYLAEHNAGRAVTEVDVFLPDGGDVVRPDVSFLLSESLHRAKTHIHGAPDLICEVLSSRTRARDLGDKAERYLACGVKEYWLVDPRARTVQLWANAGATWQRVSGERLESQLLPELCVHSDRLFG
jgi:Uma2 family endonuclease